MWIGSARRKEEMAGIHWLDKRLAHLLLSRLAQ